MYKEAKRLVSGEHLTSQERKRLEAIIRGGIAFKEAESKFSKDEFLGVYGFDTQNSESVSIKTIAKHMVTDYLEDSDIESLKRLDYTIYLIEHKRKADKNQLVYLQSVCDTLMSQIIDMSGYSGFVSNLGIDSKWGYLVYMFWRHPSNCHRYYLDTKKNELSIDKWSYTGFSYTIDEVYVSFEYRKNMRLLALLDTGNNLHFYKINTKLGDIESANKDIIQTDLSPLYVRLRMYL